METTLPKQKITLRDVAARAAVSCMTVSRVVRGFHNVSPAVHDRVSAALKDLGYHPDPSLSALSAYRRGAPKSSTAVIAFLENDRTAVSQKIWNGAVAAGQGLGYTVERFKLPGDATQHRQLERTLFHRGIHGLMFGLTSPASRVLEWDWRRYAAVSVGPLAYHPDMHSVTLDYFQCAFAACQTLYRKGRRRIALVIDPRLEASTSHRWSGGYYAALDHTRQPPLSAAELWDSPFLEKWLRKNKVDGVLTLHSGFKDPAREAWNIAHRMGIETLLLADAHIPNTEAMLLEHQKVGAEALRMLHDLLRRMDYGLSTNPYYLSLQCRSVTRDLLGNPSPA